MSDDEQERLHAIWAKENAGDFPADLPCEPEPGAVEDMLYILEMVETHARNFDYDPSDLDDASHNWTKPLINLQRDLKVLAAQAASTRWDNSGFARLLKHATGIRMRPLEEEGDKDLLRDGSNQCMVCHANETHCGWAFDLFAIHKRSGSDFLSHRHGETPLEGQRRVYETSLSNEKNEWYGRFAVGKTCLRKVHLAFWANNFLSMLYANFDEKLSKMEYDHMQRRERLPTNKFALATEENARFYVQQLELAKTLIATERTNVRLPELPLVFKSVWRDGDAQDDEICKAASDRHAYLQTVLGDTAREHLAGEDDERHQPSASSNNNKRRARYTEPDLEESEDDEPPAARRPRRRTKKKARVVDSDDDDDEDSEGFSRHDLRRATQRSFQHSPTGGEDSDGFDRDDTERAIAHSFAGGCRGGCCGGSRLQPPPSMPPPVLQRPPQPQQPPLVIQQPEPEPEEEEMEEEDIDDQPQLQDDPHPSALEDAVTKAQRRAVSLVLAIGADLAGEQHRLMDAESALRVQQASDEIAKRLAKEFGLEF
jgi:hypothetical protein